MRILNLIIGTVFAFITIIALTHALLFGMMELVEALLL